MWSYLVQFGSDAVFVVSALGVIGGAMAWTHRRVYRPMMKRFDAGMSLIEAQLSPNHGSSLLDLVGTIALEHRALGSDVKEIKKRITKVEEYVTFHHSEIGAGDGEGDDGDS